MSNFSYHGTYRRRRRPERLSQGLKELKRSKWLTKDPPTLWSKTRRGKIMMNGRGCSDRQKNAKCVGRNRGESKSETDRKDTSPKIRYDKAFHCLSRSLSLAWRVLTKTLAFLTCPACSAVEHFFGQTLSLCLAIINSSLLLLSLILRVGNQAGSWKKHILKYFLKMEYAHWCVYTCTSQHWYVLHWCVLHLFCIH